MTDVTNACICADLSFAPLSLTSQHPSRSHRSLGSTWGFLILGACNGSVHMTLGSGPLLLSDGPGSYADSVECIWLVEAAGPITAIFKSFRTQADCDFVFISEAADAPARNFSGRDLPPPFSTNATSITVKFTSDAGIHYSGFELELYALEPGGTWVPTRAPTATPTWDPGTLAPGMSIPPHAHNRTHPCYQP